MCTSKKLREAFFKDKNIAIEIPLREKRISEFSRHFYGEVSDYPSILQNKILYEELNFSKDREILDCLQEIYSRPEYKSYYENQVPNSFFIDPVTLEKISSENKIIISPKNYYNLRKEADLWIDKNRELDDNEVRIRSLEWYNKHKDKDGNIYKYGIYAKEAEENLHPHNDCIFTKEDAALCGRIGERVGAGGSCSLAYLEKIHVRIDNKNFSLHRSCFEGDEIPKQLKEKYGIKEEIKKEILLKYNKIKKKIKYLELPKLLKTKNYGKFHRSNH